MAPAADAAELRRRLGALRVQACGMAHERVVTDASPSRSGEAAIRRPPLCAAPRRSGNLACTHSMARTTLGEALRLLAERDPDGEHATDLALLATIDGGLGPLDHRRYDAETRLAEARAAGDTAGMAQAAALIADSIAAHGAAAALLDGVRSRALAALDAPGLSIRAAPREPPIPPERAVS